MNGTTDMNGRKTGHGLFVLAAFIYTVGVVSFSGWSYLRQRTNLHAQADQSLINATYATEQVLGGIFLECAVETESVLETGYAANKAKLDKLADKSQFAALGAVGRKGTETWTLIAGGGRSALIPSKEIQFQAPLPPELSTLVQELAEFGDDSLQLKTLKIGAYREQRIAIRYHATSAQAGYALVAARGTRNINRLLRALAVRTMLSSIFLYAMAFPLIALYNRTLAKTAREMAGLNTRLQQDFDRQKIREAELEDAIRDLERFNAITLGRENRIIGLKAEVNTLLEQMKRKKRYTAAENNPSPTQSQDG